MPNNVAIAETVYYDIVRRKWVEDQKPSKYKEN